MNNKKSDFTIEGSEALKKAFVEETGLTDNFSDLTGQEYYLTSHANGKGLHIIRYKKPMHFTLPAQWEEALQYVKEYFAEDEFKAGDWVTVTCSDDSLSKNWTKGKDAIGYTFKLEKGTIKYFNSYEEEIENLNNNTGYIICPTNKFGINYEKRWLRKATPEEVIAAQTKSFELGGFTAIVTEDKVEIAGRGSLTHAECIQLVDNLKASSFVIGGFEVHGTYNTITIGCVKGIPYADMKVVYDYVKQISQYKI